MNEAVESTASSFLLCFLVG